MSTNRLPTPLICTTEDIDGFVETYGAGVIFIEWKDRLRWSGPKPVLVSYRIGPKHRHIFVEFKAPWFQITDALDQFGTKPKPG